MATRNKLIIKTKQDLAMILYMVLGTLNMYTEKFNIEGHDANTLPPDCVGKNDSGWNISGEIKEDYYEWVNEFEAEHPKYGKVWGDFETEVYADSEEGYKNFIENHPPEEWDYWDI